MPLQRGSDLWGLLFPTFTATEGRLRPQTPDARASLGQPYGDRLTPPTEGRFSQERVPFTVFHSHLSLKGTPVRPGHFGCC